jgi:hypothetical protein
MWVAVSLTLQRRSIWESCVSRLTKILPRFTLPSDAERGRTTWIGVGVAFYAAVVA